MPKRFSVLLVAVLVGVTAYSFISFVASVKEKYDLVTDLEKAREDLRQLEEEKTGLEQDLAQQKLFQESLTRENGGLKYQLQVSAETLAKVQEELRVNVEESEQAIDDLSAQLFLSQAENNALAAQIGVLKQDVLAAQQEKALLEAKTNTVAGLKSMIRDLRRQTRRVRSKSRLTFIKNTRQEISEIVVGNRGFLVRNGQTTVPAKVRIEVQPSSP